MDNTPTSEQLPPPPAPVFSPPTPGTGYVVPVEAARWQAMVRAQRRAVADQIPTEPKDRTGLSASVGIGLIGAGLMVLAVIGVVVSQWDSIGRTGRALGLIAISVGVLVAARRLRSTTPTMADLLAHLDDVLIGASGIAIMSAFGFGWPSCLAVGGGVTAAAAIDLDRRWSPSRFAWFEVCGLAVAGFGLAGLVHGTVGICVVTAAIVESFFGRHRRAAALAIVGVTSPLLWILTTIGVGTGTIVDAGAAGDRLIWSAPIVGAVSAVILYFTGRATDETRWYPLASAAVAAGVFTGFLSAGGTTVAAWLSVPGALLLLAEASWAASGQHERRIWTILADIAAVWNFLLTFCLGMAGLGVQLQRAGADGAGHIGIDLSQRVGWMGFPVLFTALGIFVWWRRSSQRHELLRAAGPLGIGVLVVSGVASIGASGLLVVVAAVVVTAIAAWRNPSPIVVYPLAGWTVLLLLMVRFGASALVATFIALVALIAVVVVARTQRAAERDHTRVLEPVLVTLVASCLVGLCAPTGQPAAWCLIGAAAISLAQVTLDRRTTMAQVVSITIVAGWQLPGMVRYFGQVSDGGGMIEGFPWWTTAYAAATVAVALGWLHNPGRAPAVLTGVLTVLTVGAAGVDLGVEPIVLAVLMGAVGIALTGVGVGWNSSAPLVEAGLAATAVALVTPTHIEWLSSVLVVVFGAQIAVLGVRLAQQWLTAVGVVVSISGGVSLLWTTSLLDVLQPWAAQVEATTTDVVLFALTIALLGVGVWVRRSYHTSSWVAFVPGLAIGGLWLVGVASDRATFWALPLGLVLGVGAMGAGALHRLACPLALGTAIVISITFVSYATYLGMVPMWVWLGLGGAVLLAVGVLVERSSRRGMKLHDLVKNWD